MQKPIIGREKITEITTLLHDINAVNVVVFHGRHSFDKHKQMFQVLLSKYNVTFYSDFDPNPKKEQILIAIDKLKHIKCDAIIAFGGGSVIDFTKAFRFYSNLKAPLIAIPTTAGTGSEATQFAVVYVNGVKTSLDNNAILPDYAIIDCQFAELAPQYVKACSAMDAYSQAIESYWSVLSTIKSRHYAKQAIILIKDNIEKFVLESNKTSSENMAIAAHLAGQAINISRTTAAHALSYTLTSKYGIPHGHAVALSLANLFIENSKVNSENCNDKRGTIFVQRRINDILHILDQKTAQDFATYWYDLMSKIGMKYNIADIGIKNKKIIIENINAQRMANNPVKLSNIDNLLR